jgi:hypothetical protein
MQFSDLLELLGMVAGQMDSGLRWAFLAEFFNRHLRKETYLPPENIMCGMGMISLGTQPMPQILQMNPPGLDSFPLDSARFLSIFPRQEDHL